MATMASASGRPSPTRTPTTQTTPTAEALREFLLSSCAVDEPSCSTPDPAIRLCVAPPEPLDEFSHELAFGFGFSDEMKVVRLLQVKYAQGRELFTKVYFARGCASAIPPLPLQATEASEVAKLLRYYAGVYEILQPQVVKLRMLCDYCSQTVSVLSDTIQRIAAQENTHRVIPDVLLDGIIGVMDILLQMNQLHDAKSSLRNDFSLFKRAFRHAQGDVSDPESVAKEIQRLQEFVGSTAQSKNAIWDSLRHNLTSVKRYEQVVFLLVKQCLSHLESGRCLQPQETFKLVRVLPCLLAVLNADPVHGTLSGFHSAEKKLIEATGRVLGRYPIVPIFADLCVKPITPMGELVSVKVEYSMPPERQWDSGYDLAQLAARGRTSYAAFIPRFMFALNEARKKPDLVCNEKLASSISELAVEGIRLLCEWKTGLQLFLSAKYQRPKTDDQLEHMGVPIDNPYIEYQRVITHNIESDECSAVADIVHIINSTARVLHQQSAIVSFYARGFVYSQVQQFVQHTLVAILHRADKRKHTSMKLFLELRLSCGDWIRDEFPKDDFKKKRRDRRLPELKERIVAQPLSQLQMLRTAVNAIYTRRTSGELDARTSIFAFHRELKSSDISTLHEFYTKSANYQLLLDYESTVGALNRFPELLFRELFLEPTKGHQLPVDDSFPWIVLKRGVLDCNRDVEVASAFSLLGIYNDAATYALHCAEQTAVCNEVFAEARLFFDHLIYVVADYVFSAAKSDAVRTLIGADCLSRIQETNGKAGNTRKSRASGIAQNFRVISSMRRVMILDQSPDVMALVSGHLNVRFLRDLRSTLNRMARIDATAYIATKNLLQVLRSAHHQLSEYFMLDPFPAMWFETSTSVNLGRTRCISDGTLSRFAKRLLHMASAAIMQDLAVKYGYNARTQRFFRTPMPLELRPYVARTRSVDAQQNESSKDVGTTTSKKLLDGVGFDRDCRVGFELIHQPYRSFFGVAHVEAMVSLLSLSDMVEIVDECIEFVISQIEDVVHLFVPVLGSAIPPYRLPKLLYRTEGCYGYFESKFTHMMDSKELEAQVFHSLRVVGNTLLAVNYINQVISAEAVAMDRRGTPLDVFAHALQRLHAFLLATDLTSRWGAQDDSNPEQIDKNPSTFFLVWNALEYLSCCSPRHGNPACYREVYGEGVYFAGCTLVHLLGQRYLYELWNPSQCVLDTHRHDDTKQATTVAMHHATRGRKNAAPNVGMPTGAHAQAVGMLDSEMVENTKRFVAQAQDMRTSSHHFFSILENSWTAVASQSGSNRAEFAPPAQ